MRFYDQHDASHGLFFEATELLAEEQTPFQNIKLFDTALHGRVMLLDDVTMLTESTHHVYHEHMVHIPMASVASPRSVLVIGGGDGGAVTELVKYPALERIVLCELDGRVVDLSREHLPAISAGLDDPRVETRIGDGAAFLAAEAEGFDLVIIDSTDICEEGAHGAEIASPLAEEGFHRMLAERLRPGGTAMQMLGSPTFYPKGMEAVFDMVQARFAHVAPVFMPCPFYISGDWCAAMLSPHGQPEPVHEHRTEGDLLYYTPEIARGAMVVPRAVREMMQRASA